MANLRKYGVAATFEMPLIKAGSQNFALGADFTPAAGDVKISKDGGAAANITTLPTAVAMGNAAFWSFPLSATEMEAGRIIVTVGDAATKAVEDDAFIIETYGHVSALHEVDLDSAGFTKLITMATGFVTGTFATGTLSTTTCTTSITGYSADQLNRRVLLVTSGAALGEKVIITDYVSTGGQVYFAPGLTTAPANADTFIIL